MQFKQQILVQLFLRETQGSPIHEKSELDIQLVNSTEYQAWLAERRDFLTTEICESHWIKSCSGGYITEVTFNKNGSLDEATLFDRFATTGSWSIKDGLLSVVIHKGENNYQFYVVANRNINIHAAIEYKNNEIHSYLKLAQVKV